MERQILVAAPLEPISITRQALHLEGGLRAQELLPRGLGSLARALPLGPRGLGSLARRLLLLRTARGLAGLALPLLGHLCSGCLEAFWDGCRVL